MKKTAGQEFLEWYNNYVKEFGCSPIDFDVNYFWEYSNLKLEKQQIENAYDEGYFDQKSAEQYYKDTFKN